ncbi:MAG: 3-methyladenine DNA glycosylase [Methanobrevibacter sp.]|uniref:DNA glycosylase n=1 Tax=Methanobrevibacter sp. TaxID=66852 RepID=UPI0025CD56CE|nr:DNA glycosylase [Methanobrevibacter sp.]MBQ6100372.1 3-methyladenine DNA glycosylase [Methanobrevibacter sp.]
MIIKAPIDLELTQMSGQTSQPPWFRENDSFREVVMVRDKPVLFDVKQSGDYLDFDFTGDISKKQAISKLKYIYDLDFDLNKFYKYLSNHAELSEMSEFCNGLRLFLAKDEFECIISSISSANNSIKRWTKSMCDMKEKWGNNYFDNYYTFPDKVIIQDLFEDDDEESLVCGKSCGNNLKSCGVGYRAPYMKKASEFFTVEMDLSEIYKMSYDEAFDTILKVPGVGPKVADCILLYGFNFKEAFPSDVWIKRIVSHLYFDGKDISVSKVRDFGMEQFGENAGYVQLYMFHYARMSGLMQKLK